MAWPTGRSPARAWMGSVWAANISAYTISVVPKNVSTICSRRLMMDRNTVWALPGGGYRRRPSWRMDGASARGGSRSAGRRGDVDQVEVAGQVDADVADPRREHVVVLLEPQRDHRHVLREKVFGLLVVLDGRVLGLLLGAL